MYEFVDLMNLRIINQSNKSRASVCRPMTMSMVARPPLDSATALSQANIRERSLQVTSYYVVRARRQLAQQALGYRPTIASLPS